MTRDRKWSETDGLISAFRKAYGGDAGAAMASLAPRLDRHFEIVNTLLDREVDATGRRSLEPETHHGKPPPLAA